MGSVKLVPGDLVRVCAPAGKGAATNLPLIKTYIESLDLIPLIRDDIYDPEEPLYSNSDEIRAQDFFDALTDDNCKAIWTIRGGSGCIRLINFLEANLPTTPPTPKIIIGYSDITVLHLYLQYKYGWQTLHGPMLDGIVSGVYAPNSPTMVALRELLFGVTNLICEPTMTRLDSKGGEPSINTEVVGGNLTLVETSIATKWEINGTGKIIFLEDTGEAAYSVERSLDHMKQAGVFDSAAAVVFGDFTSPDNVQLLNLVLSKFANDENVPCPVFKLTGIGHGNVNFPLPFNTKANIAMQGSGYTFCVKNLDMIEE